MGLMDKCEKMDKCGKMDKWKEMDKYGKILTKHNTTVTELIYFWTSWSIFGPIVTGKKSGFRASLRELKIFFSFRKFSILVPISSRLDLLM